jgi:hypothetical protein
MQLFKIARVCDPYFIVTMAPNLSSEQLDTILSPLLQPYLRLGKIVRPSLLSRSTIDQMIGELPGLLHRATEMFEFNDRQLPDFESRLEGIVTFWKNNRSNFPAWFEFTCMMYLYQPSSGAAERAPSILNLN